MGTFRMKIQTRTSSLTRVTCGVAALHVEFQKARGSTKKIATRARERQRSKERQNSEAKGSGTEKLTNWQNQTWRNNNFVC